MLYERHGDYEILEWDNNGECGVWMYPGAMDEVDPVIVLPTVEAARIWVQKKLAPAQPASANRDTGWSQQDVDELGFSAMALQPAPAVASAAGDVHVVTCGRIADYVATGDFERVWAVIEGLQKQVRDGEFYQDIQAERGNDFEAETERLQAELARVKAALEPFKHEWDTYQNYAKEQDGRADVGNYLTNYRDLDVIMSACRRAATALQASAPPADGE